jgi:hypothetical protein
MESIIQVFRMHELSFETRIKIITKLGDAINHEHGMSITNELVDELVQVLKDQSLQQKIQEASPPIDLPQDPFLYR